MQCYEISSVTLIEFINRFRGSCHSLWKSRIFSVERIPITFIRGELCGELCSSKLFRIAEKSFDRWKESWPFGLATKLWKRVYSQRMRLMKHPIEWHDRNPLNRLSDLWIFSRPIMETEIRWATFAPTDDTCYRSRSRFLLFTKIIQGSTV